MTIGQTLKTYRLHAGMTQKEMAGGIVTQLFYSKVEMNKRGIDADLLIKLLTAHHFDVVSFFSRLSNQSKNQYNSYYEIESEITFAKNTKNLAKLKEIETKLNQKDNDLPSWLKFRLELAYAWVTHSNDHISTELKAKVKSLIVGEDWDRKHPASDPFTLQFVSWIAVNFLNCCYHEKADESYMRLPIKFLRELPVTPEIGFSDLLATYYESLFKHDDETKNEIIHILKKGKYYPLIKDTVA